MTLDELKVPFRWYKDAAQSNRLDPVCKEYRYQLITPNDRLLPFIIRFPKPESGSPGPAAMTLINEDSGATYNANAITINISYYRSGDWDFLVYKGDEIAGLTLPGGFYYGELALADGTVFTSESFWVDCISSGADFSRDWSADFSEDFGPLYTNTFGGLRKYTKLQWWHSCDIGNLLYQTGYANTLYLDSGLLRDLPKILEEGKEDGNKTFIPTFKKYTDTVALTDYVPEHVLNALLAIPLHDHVLVTTQNNLYIGRAKQFEVSFSMETDCYANVDMKFQTNTPLLSSACCVNNVIELLTP